MDLLYAHQDTMVWRLTRLLDGYEGIKPYDHRGWVSDRHHSATTP